MKKTETNKVSLRRIRILMINTVPTDDNGITQVIKNYLEHIDRNNFEVDLVSINKPKLVLLNRIAKTGSTVFVLPNRMKHPFLYMLKLYQISKNYDIVHIHGNSATMSMELIVTKLGKVNHRIVHCHNTSCKYKKIDVILRPIFYRLYTECYACSEMAGEWLFRNKKYIVMNNAFEIERFIYKPEVREELREKLGLKNKHVVGNVGIFNYQKNQKFLLEIFKEYKKMKSEAVLVLIGYGELEKELRMYASEIGITESVLFLGAQEKVNDLLNIFDYFVFPSLYEGLGIAIIEAEANGLPVLASKTVIPNEVNIISNFRFVSLDKPAKVWADYLMGTDMQRDNNAYEKVCRAGFSINTQIHVLENRYYNMMG